MPGANIRVNEPAGALVVDHEVHAGQVAQTQRRMGLDGRGLQVREKLVGETCGNEVLRFVGRVAGIVVVAANDPSTPRPGAGQQDRPTDRRWKRQRRGRLMRCSTIRRWP